MKSFNELGISPPILKALEEMGFNEPTVVQEKAIPHILSQKDVIVMSKTGSGKTAVFGVSILQLTDPAASEPQGLILTPTRELAVQIDSDIKKMSAHLEHRTTALYGQHSMNVETRALKNGTCIVTGTPGRVYDHIRQKNLITRNIRFLVLDEADRMLDMGFIDQVMKIVKTLPRNRITLLFSATIPSEIHRICRNYMKDPVTIEIESQTKTVDTIKQVYYRVQPNEKRTILNRLLLVEQPESCIIFCNTRRAVDQVQGFLTRKGYASHALHGDIPQGTRMKTMQQFKQSNFHILVATDVAARGIHIDDLSLVVNYDVPNEKDNYIHRIGRTGRAGNVGRAVSLVTGDDLMTLYEIEEHIGALIEEAPLPSDDVFHARRTQAEAWLQENSIKSKASVTSESSKKKSENKKSHKPAQQNRNQKSRPSQPGSAQRQPSRQSGNARHPGYTKQETPYSRANRSRQASSMTHEDQQTKVARQYGSSGQKPDQQTKPTQQYDVFHVSGRKPEQQIRSRGRHNTFMQEENTQKSAARQFGSWQKPSRQSQAKAATQTDSRPVKTQSPVSEKNTQGMTPSKKESFFKRIINQIFRK